MLNMLVNAMQDHTVSKEYGGGIIVKNVNDEKNRIDFHDVDAVHHIEPFFLLFGAANRVAKTCSPDEQFLTVGAENDDVEVYYGTGEIQMTFPSVSLDPSDIFGIAFVKETANPETLVKSFFEVKRIAIEKFYQKAFDLDKIEYLNDREIDDKDCCYGYLNEIEYMQLAMERIPDTDYLVSTIIFKSNTYGQISEERGNLIAEQMNAICDGILETSPGLPVSKVSIKYQHDYDNCDFYVNVYLDTKIFGELQLPKLAFPVYVIVEACTNLYRAYIDGLRFNYNADDIMISRAGIAAAEPVTNIFYLDSNLN